MGTDAHQLSGTFDPGVISQRDIISIRNKETVMKKLALYVLVALAAAACASNEKKETPAAVTDLSSGAQQPQSGMSSSTTQQQKPMGSVSGNPLTDPNSPLSKRSVYFDFDSNAVKDEYRGLVQPAAASTTSRWGSAAPKR